MIRSPRTFCRPARTHSGLTLIELLVVMTLASAFLLVGFRVMSLLTSAARADVADWERERVLQMLADRWREDVALANEARLTQEDGPGAAGGEQVRFDRTGDQCELILGDGVTVLYRSDGEVIERSLSDGSRRREYDRFLLQNSTSMFARSNRVLRLVVSTGEVSVDDATASERPLGAQFEEVVAVLPLPREDDR